MKMCTMIEECDFFKSGYRDHSLGEFLLSDYCFETPQFCAIHIAQQALGKKQLPFDLLPHELDRVKLLV